MSNKIVTVDRPGSFVRPGEEFRVTGTTGEIVIEKGRGAVCCCTPKSICKARNCSSRPPFRRKADSGRRSGNDVYTS
jgi:hypothetical protein|tara:strand:- start:373 stop:603 length:231 start_codon:yes stop_codon:yes gene_type:complete